MQIKTILNRIEKFKSFIFTKCKFVEEKEGLTLLVNISPRKNSKAICSKCGHPRPGYDTLQPERKFKYIPIWGIVVFFVYSMRRVDCPECGVVVERVPWAVGKENTTQRFQWFLASWAKMLSWKDVADTFHIPWHTVCCAVSMAVDWGLAHRDLNDITAIGIDEVQYKKGHKYLTLVYQINDGCKRLLWIGRERTEKTLLKFFRFFGKERTSLLKFVCTDMWKPYLKVIAYKARHALNILDRYHIVAKMNKAIDLIRNQDAKALAAQGKEPLLKHSRWCLLKRPDNLTEKQATKLKDLLKLNLRIVRAYLLKEEFQLFWDYSFSSRYWARQFLTRWCNKVMRSRIEPMKDIAKSLRKHSTLLMNWFEAKGVISLGAVEGLNNKEKLTTRKAYGYRTYKILEIALYHTMGKLPEPIFTHRFF